MKKFFFVIISQIIFFNVFSQDTLRIMAYNTLYYGVNNSFCDQVNNNLQKKNDALRKITAYAKPDVLGLNEISSNVNIHKMVLDSILNINGVTKYKRAQLTNFSSKSIVNALFYDSEKLTLHKEYALIGGDRDINFYYLYYNSPDLANSQDTVFFVFILAHLASGSSSESATKRDFEVGLVTNHIASLNNANNYFFMGDFNLYSANEAAFQRMINHSNPNARFYDPVNKIGVWSNNSFYAPYHTQSTHTSTNCFVGGGMDDRFDFIMVSSPVINDYLKVKYIPNSYVTLGQDGLRFDKSLIDSPPNLSAPAHVIQALYDMSDHLPVYLDVKVNYSGSNSTQNEIVFENWIKFENPVNENIELNIFSQIENQYSITLYDITGRKVYSKFVNLSKGENAIDIPIGFLKNGIYMLNVIEKNGVQKTIKVIKN